MTNSEVTQQVAYIKQSLASAETCSIATTEALSTILLLEPSSKLQNARNTTPTRAQEYRLLATRGRNTPAPRPKGKLKVAVLEVQDAQEERLSPPDRARLATEVVNLTLKALTEAIKAQASQKPHEKPSPLCRTSSSTQCRCPSVSGSPKPLHPRSLNQPSKSLAANSCNGRLLCVASPGSDHGTLALAQSAQVAFTTLRTLGSMGLNNCHIPAHQINLGMSALVGKLIILGLEEIAVNELRILLKRLSPPIVSKRAGGKNFAKVGWDAQTKQNLPDLLMINDIPTDPQALSLVVSSQLHILKLLTVNKRGSLVEDAFEHLQLSNPSSPANLLTQLIASEMPEALNKGIKQMETLAQAIISLCPDSVPHEDECAADSKMYAFPVTVLNYQMLALEIRNRWRKLANDQADMERELLEPFSQYLDAFIRRSKMAHVEKFRVAEGAINRLSELAGMDLLVPLRKGLDQQVAAVRVLRSLSGLAQKCQRFSEALQYSNLLLSILQGTGASKARICAILCDVVKLELQAQALIISGVPDHLMDTMQDVVQSLNGDLSGSSSELDELLVCTASLRKLAVTYLHSRSPTLDQNIRDKQDLELAENFCLEIVLLCSRFLLRYLGKQPDSKASGGIVQRFARRLTLSLHVLRPNIEAVASLAKLHLCDDTDIWHNIDSALQGCARFLSDLEVLDNSPATTTHCSASSAISLHVTLSNAYWCHYLRQKRVASNPKQIRMLLHRSIDVLKDRPPSEQQDGFLTIKFEKLAELYQTCDEVQKSLMTYTEALRVQLDAGSLRVAAEHAATKSLSQVFEENGSISTLARLMSSYCELSLRSNSLKQNSLFFDNEQLLPQERGLLLEYQLTILANSVPSQGFSVTQAGAVDRLSRSLLKIYTKEKFPIRRIRTVGQVLRIHAAQSSIFPPEFMVEVFGIARSSKNQSLGCDTGLSRYLKHLLACQDAFSTMSGRPPIPEALHSSLSTWCEIAHQCNTQAMLEGFIDDVPEWLNHMTTIAEYLRMLAFEKQLSSVLRLVTRVRRVCFNESDPVCLTGTITLGLQALKFGCSGKAGEFFLRTRRHVDNNSGPINLILQWHIAYAKFLLDTGNLDKCEQHIQLVREKLIPVDAAFELGTQDFGLEYKRTSFLADIAELQSMLSLLCSHPAASVFHARRAVRLSYRLWALLERRQQATTTKRKNRLLNGGDSVGEGTSNIALSAAQAVLTTSMTHASVVSAAFWPLVPDLFSRLLHLSKMYAQEGLHSEAQYYAERAAKIASAAKAGPRLAQANTLLCDYEVRRGRGADEPTLLSQSAATIFEECTPSDGVMAQLALANAYAQTSNKQSEEKALQLAKEIATDKSVDCFFDDIERPSGDAADLESQMHKLSLHKRKGSLHTKRQIPAEAHRSKRSQKVLERQQSVDVADTGYTPLSRLHGQVLREMGYAALRVGDLDRCTVCLNDAEDLPTSKQDLTYQALATAQLALGHGLNHILDDPVLSVLADSTISCPSISAEGRRFDRAAIVSNRTHNETTQAKKTRLTRKAGGDGRTVALEPRQLHEFLYKALIIIHNLHDNAQYTSSTPRLHLVSSVLFKTIIMLSAACSSLPQANVSPTFGVYAMELGKSISILRGCSVVQAEKLVAVRGDDDKYDVETEKNVDSIAYPTIDATSFQADYIDIIPSSWTVITMSLNEDYRELRLARLRTAQAPFILAIPFDRHVSREGEDQAFGFAEGKAELLEVIDLANFSTHDARDMSKKGAKSEWWETRAVLDARLENLLDNIESFWLGGFRGIFSQQSPRLDLLARLQRSFSDILSKHLPSRQQHRSVKSTSPVTLDAQVLELFVGLGKPTDADNFDEPLVDLLYFVIDILQFNGERNAYDEVDFDSIAVDVLETLTQYHEALEGNEEKIGHHTILILDKALHRFPWESLPCMSGQAVSRLPSLTHMRSRILCQHVQSSNSPSFNTEGYCVASSVGAYILNPGGDLASTQTTFQKPLATLTGWSATINKAPSEAEIAALLSSQPLYLYFGHGSGSQYIRSRTIKKLDRCAIALLMGCSSGTLTEEGEFESHGMPVDYLQAGAQAVVGTLWDVTDKDIDRFSMLALERWGLFEEVREDEGRSPTKKIAKGKGQARAKGTARHDLGDRAPPGSVSLDQAISDGREACLLKYLNGAAPVMYGTPVFLVQ